MKRSYIEGAKRLFLDRLAVDQQPLLQPSDIDAGPGDPYEYAAVGDSNNFGRGFDCSGLNGIVIGTALFGFAYWTGKGYYRLFSTETFPGPLPGFRRVSKQDLVNGNYPIKVMIGHYGGGPDSHMACVIDGWHMESNGDYGVIGGTDLHRKGITPLDSDYWNDWWVHDGPIEEDTEYRQPMGYPLVLDYSGGPGTGPDGHISGAVLKAAGVAAVCRYLYGAGTSLQYKQLTRAEADDLKAHGVDLVSNFESAADRMLGGASAGDADAKAARDVHRACGGPDPVQVYFSADWDATPEQQNAINDYLRACANVIGKENTGIYAGFWPLSRALDAGVCTLAWQTEAWSGNNIDSRIHLLQRNGLGYKNLDGVQCDINEAHQDNFGQWGHMASPAPAPVEFPPSDPFIAWYRGASDRDLLEYTVAQLGPGDPAWANRGMTLRDFVWEFGNKMTAPVKAAAKRPATKKKAT